MLLAVTSWLPAPAGGEDSHSLAGVWRGPWYRGMTSGLMTLEIADDATGRIAFTNLESFGDLSTPLAKSRVQGGEIEFSAIGAGGRDFTGQAMKTAHGRTLRGSARYEGFQFKFDLQRSD
jgi:hypothetical protein